MTSSSGRPITPSLTVDIICEISGGIVLVERKYQPFGWALPGGFVDVGETVEAAAIREAKEETGLDIELIRQFHVYSDPKRDARGHSVAVVFIAKASGSPVGGDDAKSARIFPKNEIPANMPFDHRQILDEYFANKY
jgi:8-oxo-dGTP diphosphatase